MTETVRQPRHAIFFCSFTQGRKTSSRLCEHEPPIFMGCLLAAAGQVGTKADCCSPFSQPVLNCNVTRSLKPNIWKDTRKAPGYQSLDQVGRLHCKTPTWGFPQLPSKQSPSQDRAARPPRLRLAWIGLCRPTLTWAWELHGRDPVPLRSGQRRSLSEARFSSQETGASFCRFPG